MYTPWHELDGVFMFECRRAAGAAIHSEWMLAVECAQCELLAIKLDVCVLFKEQGVRDTDVILDTPTNTRQGFVQFDRHR